MGNSQTKQQTSSVQQTSSSQHKSQPEKNKHYIPDQFDNMEQLQEALRNAGLESSNLIIGVDYTKSNTWTGKNIIWGVIDSIGRALEPFDDDRLIPTFGFGDATTTNKSIFSFLPNEQPCAGVVQVLQRYNEITPAVNMSGPTNFAPLIKKAIEIIIKKDTTAAIIEASHYPLSIVCIGVGDGPFDKMIHYDDNLKDSKFDNFQFVNFAEVVSSRSDLQDVIFAVKALQEIPDQYSYIKEHGLLDM
ncbi:Uncharacterized protein QTN25_006731 [Entamoeba marina]